MAYSLVGQVRDNMITNNNQREGETMTQTIKIDYNKQAQDFLNNNAIKLKITFLKNDKYFNDDSAYRDIYKFKISRNRNSYTGTFGQSLIDMGKTPSEYDILSCLALDNPCDSFEDFCSNYGYDTDSRKAERTYKAVVKQYEGLVRVLGNDSEYNPLWTSLREIQ